VTPAGPETARTTSTRTTRLLAAVAVIVAALVLAAGARPAPSGQTATCSSYGPTWAHSYNVKAKKAGNPVRIVSACCQSTKVKGINRCYIMVTLVGTSDRGCESVNIGKDGLPSGPGKHEKCTVNATRQIVA
jgi:hypothetical protein